MWKQLKMALQAAGAAPTFDAIGNGVHCDHAAYLLTFGFSPEAPLSRTPISAARYSAVDEPQQPHALGSQIDEFANINCDVGLFQEEMQRGENWSRQVGSRLGNHTTSSHLPENQVLRGFF